MKNKNTNCTINDKREATTNRAKKEELVATNAKPTNIDHYEYISELLKSSYEKSNIVKPKKTAHHANESKRNMECKRK